MDNSKEDATVRINRYLAQANMGSRRSCEELVRQGRVQVDGETVQDLSRRISPDETVRVDGKVIHRDRHSVVFALNKPVRVLTSEKDPEGRPLAITFLRPHHSGHLFSIGRLDFLSSGLLLFTNDGDLAQKLMRPDSRIDRVYTVETNDQIPEDVLQAGLKGITSEGVRYRISHYHRHSARRVTITLQEGKNREIRRFFAHFRIKVHRIHRVRYGTVAIGNLTEGQVRKLTAQEVRRLLSSLQKSSGGADGRHDRRSSRNR